MNDYTKAVGLRNPQDHDLFVGLDVDKSSIAVTLRDRLGFGKSLKMPYDSGMLLGFIENHFPGRRVLFAYEAGPTGFGLYDDIIAGGNDCIVVSPGSIAQAPNKRVKTNRLDSVKLAELLRGDQLRGIRVPTKEYRSLRSLVHLRYTYMQQIRACKCQIKALLLIDGIKFPPAPRGSGWSGLVVKSLRGLDCPVVTGVIINSRLDHLEHLVKQLGLAEASLRSFIKGSEDLSRCMEYLQSCPGIGFRIACYTLARMGDWHCFGRSGEAGAFFGLVPTENSTGDTTDRGSITKLGDPRLRSMLIQGAWMAIRRDPELREFYQRVYASHNHKVAARVAIVAVARKLADRMHCVLREQRSYDSRQAA